MESTGPRKRSVLLHLSLCLGTILATMFVWGCAEHKSKPGANGSRSLEPVEEALRDRIRAEVESPEAGERILEGLRSKDPAQKIAKLGAVARDYPDTVAAAMAWNLIAANHAAQDRMKAALDAEMEAVRSCPAESEFLVTCWYNVARFYRELGQASEGIAVYRVFLRESEAREYADQAHAFLVGVLQLAGQNSEALNEYEVFRRKHPNARAEARLTALQPIIYAYEGLGRKDEALSAAREYVKVAPKGSMYEAWGTKKLGSLEADMDGK